MENYETTTGGFRIGSNSVLLEFDNILSVLLTLNLRVGGAGVATRAVASTVTRQTSGGSVFGGITNLSQYNMSINTGEGGAVFGSISSTEYIPNPFAVYYNEMLGGSLFGSTSTVVPNIQTTGGSVFGGTFDAKEEVTASTSGGSVFGGNNNGRLRHNVSTVGGNKMGSVSRMSISKYYYFELMEDLKPIEYHPLNVEIFNKQIRSIKDDNDRLLHYFYRYRDDNKMKLMIKMKDSSKITVDIITTQELG